MFDRPGTWGIEARVPQPDGSFEAITFRFPVAERPRSLAPGDASPRSVNRTLRDVDSVHELSTGGDPDPEVYQLTIAEALDQRRPFVVVFASPGFCTNALCGPQAEMLAHIFTERPLYRPDEEVHIKGYLRKREAGALHIVKMSGWVIVEGPGDRSETGDPTDAELDRQVLEERIRPDHAHGVQTGPHLARGELEMTCSEMSRKPAR